MRAEWIPLVTSSKRPLGEPSASRRAPKKAFCQATTIHTSPTEGGWKPPNYDPAIPLWKHLRLCEWCGAILTPKISQEARKRFCDRSCSAKWTQSQPEIVERMRATKIAQHRTSVNPQAKWRQPRRCELCGAEYRLKFNSQLAQRFCGNRCSAKWQMSNPARRVLTAATCHTPEVRKKRNAAVSASWAKPTQENAARKEALRNNGRHAKPESIEKMRRSLSGRTFLARGGNGALTEPQLKLSRALGELPMEYPIMTAPVASRFKSLPNCYKVDIAYPALKVAVEVDGNTHKQKKWKFLDRRKTEVLNALGWTVLRFWNWDILTWIDTGMPTGSFISTTLRQHGIPPSL